jgi:soluble lytic murein transglycosylase-like protein
MPNYYELAQQYGNEYGVDPHLVEGVMEAESGGNPNARSPVGAEGLMQLMPGTAAGLGVKNPWDPAQNVRGGAEYLSELLKGFHGNRDEAIAGYNAGAGAVEKYGGIPPYKETQNYVRTVEGNIAKLEKAGNPKPPSEWLDLSARDVRFNLDSTHAEGSTTPTFFMSLACALRQLSPWQTIWDLMGGKR